MISHSTKNAKGQFHYPGKNMMNPPTPTVVHQVHSKKRHAQRSTKDYHQYEQRPVQEGGKGGRKHQKMSSTIHRKEMPVTPLPDKEDIVTPIITPITPTLVVKKEINNTIDMEVVPMMEPLPNTLDNLVDTLLFPDDITTVEVPADCASILTTLLY